MKQFSEIQITLDRAPHVYAVDGRYIVSSLVSETAGRVPTIGFLPVDPAQPILSAVLRPEILSIAFEASERRLSVFPDGRILFRGADEVMFQDIPDRSGAQVSHGATSVTIAANGGVIVLGPDWSVLIDPSGTAVTLDRAEGLAAASAPGAADPSAADD